MFQSGTPSASFNVKTGDGYTYFKDVNAAEIAPLAEVGPYSLDHPCYNARKNPEQFFRRTQGCSSQETVSFSHLVEFEAPSPAVERSRGLLMVRVASSTLLDDSPTTSGPNTGAPSLAVERRRHWDGRENRVQGLSWSERVSCSHSEEYEGFVDPRIWGVT